MTILETIKADQLTARKNKDSFSALLTALISDISKIAKDSGNRGTTDNDSVFVIKKFLKSIDDTLSYSGIPMGNKITLQQEKSILLAYLPKQASEEELLEFIMNHKTKSKGEIFKLLKETYNSNFDSKIANQIISNL